MTWLYLWVVMVAALGGGRGTRGGEVTYDGRSLIINGERKLLFSGSIHYARSTPEMWSSLIAKAKEGGLDVIQSYVFWNLHEPQPGQYDFKGRNDLAKFIKEIGAQGLYACLRIGPFIESEWTYGGLPFWLHDVPGIVYRSDNKPFKFYMQNFTTKIVNLMKSEGLFASQGGPIILSQIENEYQNVEAAFHEKGTSYVRWAAKLAVGLETGVPWKMCKQSDAPDPVYHGGTNFGRSGSAFVTTSYYDQAPLDEYGLIRQPKWGHLKELHATIKVCSKTLLFGKQKNFSLGQSQEAYVFQEERGAGCVAFLINNDQKDKTTVNFGNMSYELLRKSISILPDCVNVAFNTADVKTKPNKRFSKSSQIFGSADKWGEFRDVIPNFSETSLKANSLLEHMNTTKDQSDYLWYSFSYQQSSNCTKPLLHAESLGHVLHAFINDIYIGVAHGSHDVKGFTFENTVLLNNGMNNISFLGVMVGLPVGLLGEKLQIYKQQNLNKVEWKKIGTSNNQPLTWYKTEFEAPSGSDPVTLNLGPMGKGEAWVNGQSIGRYWVSFHDSTGSPSQNLYHLPRAFLKSSGNLLVLLEEGGGDPLRISLDTISITELNEHVPLYHLPK